MAPEFTTVSPVTVRSGCPNKIPQMECLQQEKFISPEFWRLEIQGQSVSMVRLSECFPGVQTSPLLAVCVMAFPQRLWERE